MRASWLDLDAALTASELNEQGVYYQALPLDQETHAIELDRLMQARGYVQRDEVALGADTPNLDAICAKFVDEHTHDDDEVRFVLEGEGVFDIRSRDDRYMRVLVEPGDLIVVPAHRNHRFMLTERRSIRCVRLFKDSSGWVPRYRES